MSEDLKERVHKCRMKHMVNGTAYLVGDLRREIAALRAENERLRADVSESRRKGHMNTKAAHEERDRANAENERLREALNWFLNDDRFQVFVGGNPNVVTKMFAEARASLSGETSAEPQK